MYAVDMEEELRKVFYAGVSPEPNTGCWLWMGSTFLQGYGCLSVPRAPRNRCNLRAHRVSYKIHKGDFDPKLYVLHTCDVPLCVNPDHLFLGTQADNIADCVSKGRLRRTGGSRLQRPPRIRLQPERRPPGTGLWPRRPKEHDTHEGYTSRPKRDPLKCRKCGRHKSGDNLYKWRNWKMCRYCRQTSDKQRVRRRAAILRAASA